MRSIEGKSLFEIVDVDSGLSVTDHFSSESAIKSNLKICRKMDENFDDKFEVIEYQIIKIGKFNE